MPYQILQRTLGELIPLIEKVMTQEVNIRGVFGIIEPSLDSVADKFSLEYICHSSCSNRVPQYIRGKRFKDSLSAMQTWDVC